MPFEFKRSTTKAEKSSAKEIVPRFDSPEDVVDPAGKAQEELKVWDTYGKKLNSGNRATEIGTAIGEVMGEVEKLEACIKETEQRIASLKARFIDRLLSARVIGILESELGTARRAKEQAYGRILRYAEFKEGFEEVAQAEEARAELLLAEAREAAEDAEARDVHAQALKHNCFFIHAIVEEEWRPSANNQIIDTTRASFNDQVAIVNGLAPTLSASTVGYGTEHRTFNTGYGAGSGVFLSEGRILAASPGDMGSRALGLYERDLSGGLETKEGIQGVIANRMPRNENQYNELVIAQPEVGGVYFRLGSLIDDDERARLDTVTPRKPHEPPLEHLLSMDRRKRIILGKEVTAGISESFWKKILEARSHGVPLYMFSEDNKAYVIATVNQEKKVIGIEEGARTPEEVGDAFFAHMRDNNNPVPLRKERAEKLLSQLNKAS